MLPPISETILFEWRAPDPCRRLLAPLALDAKKLVKKELAYLSGFLLRVDHRNLDFTLSLTPETVTFPPGLLYLMAFTSVVKEHAQTVPVTLTQ